MSETSDPIGNTNDEDAVLIIALKNGDRDAFSFIFSKYYTFLYNYGLQVCSGKDSLVKDSLQEVFLSLWINRCRVDKVHSLRSYLFKAVRLTIFRQIQKQQARHNRDHSYFDEAFREVLNIEELIIDSEISEERKRQLSAAIETLSKRKREVVYLKFYEGLTNDEIAEVMDINIQSVYNHVSTAVKLLSEHIGVSGKLEIR